MENAISRIPHGLSIVNLANTIRPSPSFQSSQNMIESQGILKSRDHPLFKPVNMKTGPKEIIFKPLSIMAETNKLISRPVAMVRPLPIVANAMVKPNMTEESLDKTVVKKEPKRKSGLEEPKEAKNAATEDAAKIPRTSNNVLFENGIKQTSAATEDVKIQEPSNNMLLENGAKQKKQKTEKS